MHYYAALQGSSLCRILQGRPEEEGECQQGLICAATDGGGWWAFVWVWEAKARLPVLQKEERCGLNNRAAGACPCRRMKGSGCCARRCWFLEEPMLQTEPSSQGSSVKAQSFLPVSYR